MTERQYNLLVEMEIKQKMTGYSECGDITRRYHTAIITVQLNNMSYQGSVQNINCYCLNV